MYGDHSWQQNSSFGRTRAFHSISKSFLWAWRSSWSSLLVAIVSVMAEWQWHHYSCMFPGMWSVLLHLHRSDPAFICKGGCLIVFQTFIDVPHHYEEDQRPQHWLMHNTSWHCLGMNSVLPPSCSGTCLWGSYEPSSQLCYSKSPDFICGSKLWPTLPNHYHHHHDLSCQMV